MNDNKFAYTNYCVVIFKKKLLMILITYTEKQSNIHMHDKPNIVYVMLP